MSPRTPSRPPFDPAAPVEQARLFTAVADLARAGLQEPLEEALAELDRGAAELSRADDLPSAIQLAQIRSACDELAATLAGEQRRVVQEIADLQTRLRQRRRYTGAPDVTPGLDRRG